MLGYCYSLRCLPAIGPVRRVPVKGFQSDGPYGPIYYLCSRCQHEAEHGQIRVRVG